MEARDKRVRAEDKRQEIPVYPQVADKEHQVAATMCARRRHNKHTDKHKGTRHAAHRICRVAQRRSAPAQRIEYSQESGGGANDAATVPRQAQNDDRNKGLQTIKCNKYEQKSKQSKEKFGR